jgi:hypothetical protein
MSTQLPRPVAQHGEGPATMGALGWPPAVLPSGFLLAALALGSCTPNGSGFEPRTQHPTGVTTPASNGGVEPYRDSYSFRPEARDRLARAGIELDEPPEPRADTPAAASSLVSRCQAEVEQKLNAELAPANVRFENARSTATNPEVTNVHGDADVEPHLGPMRRYTYYCSFRTHEGNRLSDLGYVPNDQPESAHPSAMLAACEKEVLHRMRADAIGGSGVRFEGARAVEGESSTTRVLGEAQTQSSGAPERYRYECTFRPDEGTVPVFLEVRPIQ